MNITFYTNNSEPEKVTKDITSLSDLPISGTLREGASILRPSILMAGAPPMAANYMYVQETGRYYYITDVRLVRNELYVVEGRVDVLMSYADGIRAQQAIVRRQENNWNLYLNDGSFRTYSDPDIIVTNFSAGFSADTAYILMTV